MKLNKLKVGKKKENKKKGEVKMKHLFYME
jgi:hypothetical protein